MPLIPTLWRLRQECFEFEATLDYISFEEQNYDAKEMAQQLKALAVLPKDPGSILSTDVVAHIRL